MKLTASEVLSRRAALLQESARLFLCAFDLDETPGTENTPNRFADIFLEADGGDGKTPQQLLGEMVMEDETYRGMLVENGLTFTSYCEHHLLPFFGEATIGYVPSVNAETGKTLLVGLSKFPRVLRAIANGPNVQERITQRVADIIEEVIHPRGVAVVISATHLCMASRGVRTEGSLTITSVLTGVFLEPSNNARTEFLDLRRKER